LASACAPVAATSNSDATMQRIELRMSLLYAIMGSGSFFFG
jgi:hypothetical protein